MLQSACEVNFPTQVGEVKPVRLSPQVCLCEPWTVSVVFGHETTEQS